MYCTSRAAYTSPANAFEMIENVGSYLLLESKGWREKERMLFSIFYIRSLLSTVSYLLFGTVSVVCITAVGIRTFFFSTLNLESPFQKINLRGSVPVTLYNSQTFHSTRPYCWLKDRLYPGFT